VYLTRKNGFTAVKSFKTGRSFVIAAYKTSGKAYSLTYGQNRLFLADHKDGVKIINIANPSNSSSFTVTNHLPTTYAESVVQTGSRLIVADGKGGIVLGKIIYSGNGEIQISDPEAIKMPGRAKSVTVYGNKAYIAARADGLHILDLDTKEITSVFPGGSVQQSVVTDNAIYMADGSGGVKIYSSASEPALLAAVTLHHVSTIASITNNIIAAGGEKGISLLNVSDLKNPKIVSSYPAGWIEDIYFDGRYIYAAAGSEGLIVLDAKNPENPVLVSTCKDVYAVGVKVENNLAFVADVEGFKVVKILIPSWLE